MPFSKGDPNINRKGRIDGGGLSLTKLLKEQLEKVPEGKEESYKEIFIKTLMHKAIVEKDNKALKLIMNYVDGMPKQSIEFQGEIKNIITGFNYVKPDNTDNNTDDKTGSSVE